MNSIKTISLLLCLLTLGLNGYGQGTANLPSQNINYRSANKILVAGKTLESSMATLQPNETIQKIDYLDDLGRSIELITTKGAPSQNDIILHKALDQYGRESSVYYPYSAANANPGFFQSGFGSSEKTISYEPSPLGRVTSASNSISGGGSYTYGAGTVRSWTITDYGNMRFALQSSFYPYPLASVTTTENGTGVQQISYTDPEGRTVLTKTQQANGAWAETNYIYDPIQGDLRFILTPEASSQFANLDPSYTVISQNTTLTAPNTNKYYYVKGVTVTLPQSSTNTYLPNLTISPYPDVLDKYAYQFVYDTRHRKIAEKKPGADWKYFVYDSRDRLALSQDGVQRLSNQWTFAKYDYLNRPILTGIVTLTDSFSSLQTTYDNIAVFNEDVGSIVHGYTNNTLPNVSDPDAYLSVTYYDDYSFPFDLRFTYYDPSLLSGLPPTANTHVRGLVTACKVKILDNLGWHWLYTSTFYDDHFRPIQVIGMNQRGYVDIVSTTYNFAGSPIATNNRNSFMDSGSSIPVSKTFSYDAAGRLTQTTLQVYNQPPVIETAMQYNELNQLSGLSYHSTDQNQTHTFIDNSTYSYDNTKKELLLGIAHKRPDGFNYFSQNFAYTSEGFDSNASASYASNNARVDGLPGGIQWYPDNATKNRYYFFNYDKNKQLLAANYKQIEPLTQITKTDLISENNLSYDLNGNIKSLNRYAGSITAQPIDQLNYNYSQGNQLNSVTDATGNSLGFNDQNSGANDYTYDLNGNVTSDKNKGIISITYNLLNLPSQVTFSNGNYIQYTYNAGGVKLNQTYFNSAGTAITNTDYVGSQVWINGVVQVINTSSGRIVPSSNQNLIALPDCGSATGFSSNGCALSTPQSTNGQSYVMAVAQGTYTGYAAGATNIGNSFSVKQGENYKFRVLGYTATANNAYLVIKGNNSTSVVGSTPLPSGSANENWVEMSYLVPAGVTSITVNVLWNSCVANDAFYINHVSLYKTDWEYQYFIKDNIGSVRAVLQTNPKTITYLATMEPANAATENSAANFNNSIVPFIYLSPTTGLPVANSTPGALPPPNGSAVCQLNYNTKIGPNKSLRVLTGDKIDLQVTSYFPSATSSLSSIGASVMMSSVAAVMSGGSQPVIDGINYAYANPASSSNLMLSPPSSQGTTTPSAYLNYILFDDNYIPVKAQSIKIGSTANTKNVIGVSGIQVDEPGYIFIYLSYDDTNTTQVVFFDDLRITLTEGNMIQANTYYPFGLVATSWTRAGEQDNRYYYQGKELDPNTNWQDFGSRMYYADLGRWFSQDPQSQFSSPYKAMGNVPMIAADPDGEFAFLIPMLIGAVMGGIEGYQMAEANHASGWGMFGYIAGGAAIGGASGYLGAAAAAGGGAFANTGGIALSSTTNSLGMSLLGGGTSQASTSFGAFSINWGDGDVDYLGKEGNSNLENVGYGLGGLSNLNDVWNTAFPKKVGAKLLTDGDDPIISHSAWTDNSGGGLISFGPDKNNPFFYSEWKADAIDALDFGSAPVQTVKSYGKFAFGVPVKGTWWDYSHYNNWELSVPNANQVALRAVGTFTKILPYQGLTLNCVNMASLGGWLSGIPNIGLHPWLLHASMTFYTATRYDLFSYYLTKSH